MAETNNKGGFFINNEQILLIMGGAENLRILCLAFMPGADSGVTRSKNPMKWDGGGLTCPLGNNECVWHARNPGRSNY